MGQVGRAALGLLRVSQRLLQTSNPETVAAVEKSLKLLLRMSPLVAWDLAKTVASHVSLFVCCLFTSRAQRLQVSIWVAPAATHTFSAAVHGPPSGLGPGRDCGQPVQHFYSYKGYDMPSCCVQKLHIETCSDGSAAAAAVHEAPGGMGGSSQDRCQPRELPVQRYCQCQALHSCEEAPSGCKRCELADTAHGVDHLLLCVCRCKSW